MDNKAIIANRNFTKCQRILVLERMECFNERKIECECAWAEVLVFKLKPSEKDLFLISHSFIHTLLYLLRSSQRRAGTAERDG